MESMRILLYLAALAALLPIAARAETNVVKRTRAETNDVDRMHVDGVAAYVNAHVITLADVMVLIEPVRRQLIRKYRGEALQERLGAAFDNALNTLVERFLVLDAYKEQGGRLPEWTVDQRAEEMIDEMFGGDRDALMRALQLEKMTYEEWRETLEQQMIVQSMRSANVDQYIEITPRRVRAHYRNNAAQFRRPTRMHVRMIVLTPEQAATAAQRQQRAAELVQRLRDRADFAALAKQVSGGSHADVGGDWGWIDPARELRRELAQLAESTATGQVSDAVRIADNYYIMKIEGRREASMAPLRDVYDDIERVLRQEAIESGYTRWITRLKQDAYVKYEQMKDGMGAP